jgi:hypothetical protein
MGSSLQPLRIRDSKLYQNRFGQAFTDALQTLPASQDNCCLSLGCCSPVNPILCGLSKVSAQSVVISVDTASTPKDILRFVQPHQARGTLFRHPHSVVQKLSNTLKATGHHKVSVALQLAVYLAMVHSASLACAMFREQHLAKSSYCCLCQLACFLRVFSCHRRLTLNPCQRQRRLQRHMTWGALQALKQW